MVQEMYDNVIRVVYATICAVALGLMCWRAFGPEHHWRRYSGKVRDYWWALASWCGAAIVGAIEVLSGVDSSFRVFLVLFASILTLKGAWQGRLTSSEINSIQGVTAEDEKRALDNLVREKYGIGQDPGQHKAGQQIPDSAFPGGRRKPDMYWDENIGKWRRLGE